MSVRNFKMVFVPTIALLTLCACASNIEIYESPTSGPLSKITLVNAADTQKASLATFDDGIACVRKRHIQFEIEDKIAAGTSRSLTVSAGKILALFVSLDSIESDDYDVDIGITGGGPAPVRTRTVTAIGCNSRLSFMVEADNDYHVVIAEPTSNKSCSIVVSEVNEKGEFEAVETTQRVFRPSRNELGAFCEPLVQQ